MTARRANDDHWDKFLKVWNTYSEVHGITRYFSTGQKKKRNTDIAIDEDNYIPLNLPGENGVSEDNMYATMFATKLSTPVPVSPDANLLEKLPLGDI